MKNFKNIFFSCLSIVTLLLFTGKSFATVFTFDISLSGAQEFPSNPSTGLGNLTGTYDDVTNVLSFTVVFTGLVSPATAGHFHAPAASGVNAAVVKGFVGFPTGVTSGSYSNFYTLTAAEETQLLCGLWYINIHSIASPGGEIRGQLTEAAPSSFNITLSGGQEVPSNPSTGLGNLTATYTDATNTLSFNLVFTGLLSPTIAAHFHAPAAVGFNALVVIDLTGFPTGVTSGAYSNSYILTAAQETQLLTGQWYINIHSSASPTGEIRGQLLEGTLPSNCSNPPPPAITSFNPSTGPPGTSVTITGTNFNAIPGNNIVFFGAVKATVSSGTTMSLTVTVPAGATYQPISVLNIDTDLTGYSSKPFITTFTNPVGIGIPANFYKPKVDFVTGNSPRNVATGDLDGDGKPELVISNGNSNTLSVLRNISSSGTISASTFAAKVDFASGNFTEYVALGDVDGDGKHDMVVATNANISVLRNTSTSGIIDATSFAAKVDFTSGFTSPVFVAIGDVDGDGKPDIVTANSTSNSVSVRRNLSTTGVISFAAKVDFTTGGTPLSVAIGDLDADGKQDLAVANSAANVNTISVLLNTSTPGSISFLTKVDFTTGLGPRSVAVGDLDGDGKPDIMVANSSTATPNSTTVSVLRNTSTPGVINATSFEAKVDFTAGTAPRYIAAGDLDGDGKPDMAVANINSISMSVFRNTATPGSISVSSFAAKRDFTTGSGPVAIAIVDLDGDGIPEIAAANGSASSVSVFQIDFTAIPVTLTDIKAIQKNAGVQVEWTAQQEINIDRYEVERSQNGQQFTKLGTVAATGNSSVVTNYKLFDPNPYKGVSFYRIKIIETGQLKYSRIARVNITDNKENTISIYPNPIEGNNIVLQMNLQKGKYTLYLTDNLGQQLVTKQLDHSGGSVTEIMEPANGLAKGVYQLKLSGSGINILRQVIKN